MTHKHADAMMPFKYNLLKLQKYKVKQFDWSFWVWEFSHMMNICSKNISPVKFQFCLKMKSSRISLIFALTCCQIVDLLDVKDTWLIWELKKLGPCCHSEVKNLLECLLGCVDDNYCASECNRESIICIDSMFIHLHWICNIKNVFLNNLGCRTPAVLVLNSYSFDNKPMIIDFNGKIVRFIEFFRIIIKGTSMMTYNLSMGKIQWHIMVVELLLWVNFGI